MDGKEKKEGKEKLTKTAAAANSVRALSMITYIISTDAENSSDWQCCDDVKKKVKEPAKGDN